MSVGIPGGVALGIPGLRVVTGVSLNPGALAAVTAVDIDSAVVATANDLVLVIPPATLEARLAVQGAFITAGTVRVRFTNQSAAAAGGGALLYTLLIFERP